MIPPMLWGKNRKKDEAPKKRNLFREAFFPQKKAIVPKRAGNVRIRKGIPMIAVLWAGFFMTVTYILFVSSFHSIADVSVSGTETVSDETIEAFFRDRMNGRRIGIFPKDNFFLLSSSEAEHALLEHFPKLRSVEIRKRFPGRIEVAVSERDRIPLWCVSGTCVLLGDDGAAKDARFAESSENEPFLFRIEDSGARAVAFGERILDERTLSRILGLESEIRISGTVGIVPRAVTPSRVSGEFRFTTVEGWDIMTTVDPDPTTIVASLRLVLEKEIPEEKRTKLRYVDLRTEKKAFYSFIPEEPVSEEVSKSAEFDSEDKKSER
ncbi:MAG: FtsQ-type POTRA domain-containing protein [Candidatus Moranbacteria bacterium]|nr:FtsQ-type POTRA domain-containing protein [Candidatus Moranbacteria bacterium]